MPRSYTFGVEAPVFVSTVKAKQAEFTDTYNYEESFCYWLADLQARRVIPSPR
jgi:hypothetical protein